MVSIASQFSLGDQGSKEAFWRTGFSVCQNPTCTRDRHSKIKTIKSEDFPAGCRMNGDAYGTTVFTCQECDWKTSFQYDDASETYYYETRFYNHQPPTPPSPHPWDDIQVEEWYQIYNVDPRVRSKLRAYQFSSRDLSEMSLQRFMALGLKKPQAEKMIETMARTNHDLLTGAYEEKKEKAQTK